MYKGSDAISGGGDVAVGRFVHFGSPCGPVIHADLRHSIIVDPIAESELFASRLPDHRCNAIICRHDASASFAELKALVEQDPAVQVGRLIPEYVTWHHSPFRGTMPSYCEYAPSDPLHGRYHDMQYGFPLTEDTALFERLALEINQAGLSWTTILKKKESFHRAFEGFDVDRVAAYGPAERARLLADAGIIRNRLKVDAVIENARRIQALRDKHGSFAGWLDAHHPRSREEWTRLFKKTFVFTGGEIVSEFLLSAGYLPGAHAPDCPIYAKILALNPPWARAVPDQR